MIENVSTAYQSPAKIKALVSHQQKEGYLSKEAITEISKDLGVPIYESYGIASFFPHFHLEKPAKPNIHICRDMSCLLAGGEALLENAQKARTPRRGQKRSARRVAPASADATRGLRPRSMAASIHPSRMRNFKESSPPGKMERPSPPPDRRKSRTRPT